MTITNAEIVSRLKLLADFHAKVTTASGGYITCNDLIDYKDIEGYFICFITGDYAGADAVISSFDTTTGRVDYFDLGGGGGSNTDEFCIVSKGYQSEVAQAALVISEDFKNRGIDDSLFLVDAQLKELHIAKAIELACYSLMNDAVDTDAYYANAERFNERYRTIMANLIADYDDNEDGSISSDEEDTSIGQVGFSR